MARHAMITKVRPYENSAPIDHLDLAGEVRRWSGVRTACQITAGTEEARS